MQCRLAVQSDSGKLSVGENGYVSFNSLCFKIKLIGSELLIGKCKFRVLPRYDFLINFSDGNPFWTLFIQLNGGLSLVARKFLDSKVVEGEESTN